MDLWYTVLHESADLRPSFRRFTDSILGRKPPQTLISSEEFQFSPSFLGTDRLHSFIGGSTFSQFRWVCFWELVSSSQRTKRCSPEWETLRSFRQSLPWNIAWKWKSFFLGLLWKLVFVNVFLPWSSQEWSCWRTPTWSREGQPTFPWTLQTFRVVLFEDVRKRADVIHIRPPDVPPEGFFKPNCWIFTQKQEMFISFYFSSFENRIFSETFVP